MSQSTWERYLAAGEKLAAEPELFDRVVVFIEAIAAGGDARLAVVGYLGECCHQPSVPTTPTSAWTIREIADVLCLVEPRLAELEDMLDAAIRHMSAADREEVAEWALSSHRGEDPTVPGSVAQLFALLHEPSESES